MMTDNLKNVLRVYRAFGGVELLLAAPPFYHVSGFTQRTNYRPAKHRPMKGDGKFVIHCGHSYRVPAALQYEKQADERLLICLRMYCGAV